MLRTRLRGGLLAVCLLVVAAGAYTTSKLAAQNSAPTITTDKTGYLLGESVSISGSGFAAGESVTVQVAKADGSASYESIAAVADDEGRISASWTLADVAARGLSISASGDVSGAADVVRVNRVAQISTDKYDYLLGEVVQISGAGFDPAESVSIQVQHSNGNEDSTSHLPFAAVADDAGNIEAEWLPGDDAEGSIFRITATGGTSDLVATTTITDPPVTVIDTAGVDDVAGSEDLHFYQFENFNGLQAAALTLSFDDTAFGAPTVCSA